MRLSRTNLGPCAALLLFAGLQTAFAEERPVVVELFTSQSCYSCPPAEAYLGELANEPGIIALELHVDYWDELVYGSAGRWKDVFSDPAFTARQRAYNRAIRGTGAVYTPQMVIDGHAEVVGFKRDRVREAIAAARRTDLAGPELDISARPGGGFLLTLDGPAAHPARIYLARFDRLHSTAVEAGENKGKTLDNHHVVRALDPVGQWQGGPLRIELPDPGLSEGQGCAVLVQTEAPGLVLAAAACPAAGA